MWLRFTEGALRAELHAPAPASFIRDPPEILAPRTRVAGPESPSLLSRGAVSLVTAKSEPGEVE